MTVAIIRSSEVLPAPFGPSRPNTPGPTSRLTPATAWLRPKRRVRSVISIFMVPSWNPGGVYDDRDAAGRDEQEGKNQHRAGEYGGKPGGEPGVGAPAGQHGDQPGGQARGHARVRRPRDDGDGQGQGADRRHRDQP